MKKVRIASVVLMVALVAVTGVAYALVEAPYTDADCTACHGVGTDSIAQSKVDFSAASVDFEKCKACHAAIPLPNVAEDDHFHRTPWNWSAMSRCGSGCHDVIDQPIFTVPPGEVIEPLVSTPYGYFLSVDSPSADLVKLHEAHDGTNWVNLTFEPLLPRCATCHGAASCNACHTDPVHGDHGGTPSCTAAGCHPAAAPSAIPSCLGCHPDASGTYHGAAHASDTEGCSGSYCHQTPDLMSVHTQRNAAFECATCHNVDYSAQITAGVTDCLACHEAAHENIAEVHTASASQECVDCHKSADLFVLHEDADAGPCAVCHSVAFLPESADCANCHAYSPVAVNHYPAAAHRAVTNSGCGNCHSLDLNTEHAKYSVGCVACHGGAFDSVVADWDKTCDGCHPTRHRDRDWGGGSRGWRR